MTRKDLIRANLERAENRGAVSSWCAYSPGDRKGTRWVVAVTGAGNQTFTTKQVELFLDGVFAA